MSIFYENQYPNKKCKTQTKNVKHRHIHRW